MKILLLVLLLFIFSFSVESKTFSRSQLLFGNVLSEITISANISDEKAYFIIQAWWDQLKTWNKKFSTYEHSSEMHKILNLKEVEREIPISKEMKEVLIKSKQLYKMTNGYFDVTFSNLSVTSNDFEILNQKLIPKKNNLKINPTGLLKGYFLDKLSKRIKKISKVDWAMISLGGDILFYSRNANNKITVGIRDPWNDTGKSLTDEILKSSCISTAGQYERKNHIKNIKLAKSKWKQVSVIAKDCYLSDGLSTGMLYMPIEKVRKLVHQNKIKVVLVDENRKIVRLSYE